ncbi:transcriptional regulator [Escherichia sp. E1130]|nr:transcriptional regulator [Escherichia sp. E1130]TLI62890.1 transcriptional regulator [Escherichia sp. E1130]
MSWHYPNSPKSGKKALTPSHNWLQREFSRKHAPLRIWFFPQ